MARTKDVPGRRVKRLVLGQGSGVIDGQQAAALEQPDDALGGMFDGLLSVAVGERGDRDEGAGAGPALSPQSSANRNE
jgi:hypothetical protein